MLPLYVVDQKQISNALLTYPMENTELMERMENAELIESREKTAFRQPKHSSALTDITARAQ